MAFFGVTPEVIDSVKRHPGADRLDIATLKGMEFSFVVGRDSYKPGDEVLYFPVDCLMPFDLMSELGLVRERKKDGETVLDEDGNPEIVGTLSGKEHNRLKTVKIRGAVSQGVISSMDILDGTLPCHSLNIHDWYFSGLRNEAFNDLGYMHPDVITGYLGVEKYEPQAIMAKNANLLPLPEFLSTYDIEGADRYSDVADILMDQEVMITEKMEGANFSASINSEGKIFVNQRKYTIQTKEGTTHSFWEVSKKSGLLDALDVFGKEKAPNIFGGEEKIITNFTIYGEFIGTGVQGNIYGLKQHEVRVFDIKVNGSFINVYPYLKYLKRLCVDFHVSPVPLLFHGKLKDFLDGKTIQEMSNGMSALNPKVRREGIVIRPAIEQYNEEIGRLILKQRSGLYLAKEK